MVDVALAASDVAYVIETYVVNACIGCMVFRRCWFLSYCCAYSAPLGSYVAASNISVSMMMLVL